MATARLVGRLTDSGKDSASILKALNGQAAEFRVFWAQGRNIGEEMVASMEAVHTENSAEDPAEEVTGIEENERIEAAIEEQAGVGDVDVLTEEPPDEASEAAIEEQVEPEETESEKVEVPEEEPADVLSDEVVPEGSDELAEMGEIPVEDWDYQRPRRGQVRTGVILSIGEQEIIVDVGAKRDGIVPYADMQRMGEALAELRVGSEVPVYVLRPEDQEGNLLLSLYMAREQQSWIRAQELFDSGEVWEEEVIGYNKGGLVVPLDDIRGFVPASQVPGFPHGLSQEERLTRLSSHVGETLPVKVIEINRRKRRLILSATAAQQDWRKQARARLLSELREGQVCKGTVSSLCSFGAFVDLGGADGLIHLSELSWRRIRHPREVVSVGDEVEVYVLRLDNERQRIGLSLKRLLPEPWALVEDKYELGQLIEGVVTNVVDFGAFAEVEEGVEGLIHVSELAEATISHPRDVVKKGDLLLLRVIRIDTRRKRLGLSLKRVLESEWAEWAARLAAENEEKQAAALQAEELVAEAEAEAAEPEEEPAAEAVEEAAEAEEEPVAEEVEEAAEAEEEPVAEEVEEAAEFEEEPVAEAEEEAAEAEEGPVAEAVEEAAEAEAEEEAAESEEEPVAEAEEEAAEAEEEPVAEAVEEAAEAEEEPVAEAVEEAAGAEEEPVAEAEEEAAESEEEPVAEAVEEAAEAEEEPVAEAVEEAAEAEEEPVAEAVEEAEEAEEEPVAEAVEDAAEAEEEPVAEAVEEAAEAEEEPVAEAVEEAAEAEEEPADQQEETAQDPEPAAVNN